MLIWANAESVLLLMKQDPDISREAGRYLRWMIPDLIALAGAQPVRVYLRSQVRMQNQILRFSRISGFCFVDLFKVCKLVLAKQDAEIAWEAGPYLRWMIPDLIALAGAQPVRVYLRSQVLPRIRSLVRVSQRSVETIGSFFSVY